MYWCDRCGKEVLYITLLHIATDEEKRSTEARTAPLEVCESCKIEILELRTHWRRYRARVKD